jgi:hypothetical protein
LGVEWRDVANLPANRGDTLEIRAFLHGPDSRRLGNQWATALPASATDLCAPATAIRKDDVLHEVARALWWGVLGACSEPGLISPVTDDLTREELVRRLAEASHTSWMKQEREDLQEEIESLSEEITDHDLDRAEDTVQELERLGIWPPA